MAGTISRGVRAPIVRQGDDVVKITVDAVLKAMKEDGFTLEDRDIVAVTESIVARAAGNFAGISDIGEDVRQKLGGGTVGVVFPIYSRNRFGVLLKGIAKGAKKVVVQLSYPTDEVGNRLVDDEKISDSGINPYTDTLTGDEFHKMFGDVRHIFTGVDYIDYYRETIESVGAEAEIILSNRPEAILKYTDCVICADIHTYESTKKRVKKAGGRIVLSMADILNAPVNGSGYNSKYGLYGSNRSTDDTVKLFPNNSQEVAEAIAKSLSEKTGKKIEAMVYGDGAFKDPVGLIWELADPVVSPGYTAGLEGLPNELKLKYLADNQYANLNGDDLAEAIRGAIRKKDGNLKGTMSTMGTTPRRLTDLIGSLCDLTSGSGDKGTPIIVIQNYFKNFAM